MPCYRFTQWTPVAVVRELVSTRAGNRQGAAHELALIAEVDERKIYAEEGYPGIREFCTALLQLTDDAAAKRIQAARLARRYPVLFEAVADGRLHRTALVVLAPHVTTENLPELIEAARHRSRSQIEAMLAERSRVSVTQQRLAPIESPASSAAPSSAMTCIAATADSHAPGHVGLTNAPTPTRAVTIRIEAEDEAMLESARELLPGLDVSAVYRRALQQMVQRMRRRKFGHRDSRKKPAKRRGRSNDRTISPGVRAQVYERDGGTCTFVSESGHRCGTRRNLEFDHIVPIARGGKSMVDNLRLLCRTHNQLVADRTFGAGYMKEKRLQRPLAPTTETEPPAAPPPNPRTAEFEQKKRDVIGALRGLRATADEMKQAAATCDEMPDAPLEECLREALKRSCRVRAKRIPAPA